MINNDDRNVRKSLEITTMIGCPLMCTFCPQDKLTKAYKDPIRQLSLENYTTILEKLPLEVQIVFAGYTEPWANKLCNQFVNLALTKGFYISIFTTLHGMNLDQSKELVNMIDQHSDQVLRFWIHLPDVNGNMLGFKHSEEYEQVLKIIKGSRNVRIREMTMDHESRISPKITVPTDPLKNWYPNTRANNLDLKNIKNQPINLAARHELPIGCVRTKNYNDNVLLPNGDVALCCMDYGLKHIIGNLLTQSYDDIINGKELQQISKSNKENRFSNDTLCRECTDAYPLNVDVKNYKHPDPNRQIKLI
jgi:hypothetical protein